MSSIVGTPIAQRSLTVDAGGSPQVVPVTIYLPRASGDDWCCAYEIGWPSKPRRYEAYGVDSVQAILLAMQMIGAELYFARPAGVQELKWLEKNGGFGFPLASSIRDLAVGDDRSI